MKGKRTKAPDTTASKLMAKKHERNEKKKTDEQFSFVELEEIEQQIYGVLSGATAHGALMRDVYPKATDEEKQQLISLGESIQTDVAHYKAQLQAVTAEREALRADVEQFNGRSASYKMDDLGMGLLSLYALFEQYNGLLASMEAVLTNGTLRNVASLILEISSRETH